MIMEMGELFMDYSSCLVLNNDYMLEEKKHFKDI